MNTRPTRIPQFLWIALSCLTLASCNRETRRQYYERMERVTVDDRNVQSYCGHVIAVQLLDSTLVDIRKQLQSMDSTK